MAKRKILNKKQALQTFLEVFTTDTVLYDIGVHLSCMECNALADLLRAHDKLGSAQELIDGHCKDDDEGDDPEHYARKLELEQPELQDEA